MASLVDLINYCRLRMHPLQLHLLSFYLPSRDPIDHLAPVKPWVIPHLRWWMVTDNLVTGHPLRPPRPSIIITTDASLSCWGASITSPPYQIAGLFDREERLFHINILEMLAISRALQYFQSSSNSLRQCHRSGIYQPSRRDLFGSPLPPNVGAPSLVYTPQGCPVGSVSPGQKEPHCRLSIQGRDGSY